MQKNTNVSSLTPNGGGYDAELPENQPLPSWTYLQVSDIPNTTLQTVTGLMTMRLQIDCYGYTPFDAIMLSKAIDGILNGYQGTLSDPDKTYVSACIRSDRMNFFDPAARTQRRMLEYEILYCE